MKKQDKIRVKSKVKTKKERRLFSLFSYNVIRLLQDKLK